MEAVANAIKKHYDFYFPTAWHHEINFVPPQQQDFQYPSTLPTSMTKMASIRIIFPIRSFLVVTLIFLFVHGSQSDFSSLVGPHSYAPKILFLLTWPLVASRYIRYFDSVYFDGHCMVDSSKMEVQLVYGNRGSAWINWNKKGIFS